LAPEAAEAMGSEAGDEGVSLRNENSDIQEGVNGGRHACQGGFRGGQTAIVASEQRPLRAGRSQKQETPAGGPAGVDGGQNALAVGLNTRRDLSLWPGSKRLLPMGAVSWLNHLTGKC
jgi:hypothetical protein